MVVALFSQPLARGFLRPAVPDFSREEALLDSLEGLFREPAARVADPAVSPVGQAFAFNPNITSAQDLERLGFSPRLAQRIINYRESGGIFRKKSDLLRIYGMDTALYRRLYPFVDLPERAVRAYSTRKTERKVPRPAAPFDLNTADTSQLIGVRGIGSILASRIVRYRERLGGYISMDQLHEVFRLDSSAVDALSAAAFIGQGFTPVRMNANTTDEYDLSRHPYIGRALARLIVTYRFQHGPFRKLEELRQIHQVDDSVYQRISVYLATD